MDWQPIETAPKDGRDILVYREGLCYVAVWEQTWQRWMVRTERIPGERDAAVCLEQVGFGSMIVARGPTHWMPLPAPPEGTPFPPPGFVKPEDLGATDGRKVDG